MSAEPTTVAPPGVAATTGARSRPMARLGQVLGCTEGQAYTLAIGAVLAVLLTLTAAVPALRSTAPSSPAAVAAGRPAPTAPTAPLSGIDAVDIAVPSSEPLLAPEPVRQSQSSTAAPPAATSASSPSVTDGGSPPAPSAPFGTTTVYARVPAPGLPEGVAADRDGRVYVSTGNAAAPGVGEPSRVFVYGPGGGSERDHTVAGQPESRVNGLAGMAVGADNALLVADPAGARVLRLAASSGEQTTFAQLPDLAPCTVLPLAGCEPGLLDDRPAPRGIAVAGDGTVYVADAGQATVWRVGAGGGTPQVWHQHADYADGNGLAGVTVDASGAVLVAAPRTVTGGNTLGGAVYRIAGDGAAQQRSVVVAFAPGDEPTGVAAGASGRTYVSLRGANAIAVVDVGGKEVRRVTSAADAAVPFDRPAGVAFVGRSLLVANSSSMTTPERWAVLAVAVEDDAVGS